MAGISRRRFVQSSMAGVVSASWAGKLSSHIVGANNTVRLAICGLYGRGGDHIKEFAKMPGVAIACLVDPDSRTFEKRQKQLRDLGCPAADVEADVRKVLERKDIDAITIAAPNHWHALMTVWACQAGNDVFVEKPCSHNLHEGRIAVAAARKHHRIVEHGTQRRAWKSYQNLAAVVRSGQFGPLRIARGIVYKLRLPIGHQAAADAPKELDFNLWTGPAAQQPFHANLVHYNWHWFWEFGNGDIGNQGVHQMDVARWMIPNAQWPRHVFSLGGRFGIKDQGETPNTQLTIYDYGETKLIFEVRGLPTAKYPNDPHTEGSVLHFDDGVIVDFKFFRSGGEPGGEPLPQMELPASTRVGDNSIFANFIACVRNRKQEQLCADIAEGHVSSGLCHLGNISYRLGQDVACPRRSDLPELIPQFGETYEQMEKHLQTAPGFDREKATMRVGKLLQLDSDAIVNINGAAAALATRPYRAPFVVPEKI